ncbi:MAG: TolC family protein [Balneolaceae bacterium]|nr:TolC family protein [Balneolaceae bacterium]
MNKEKLYAIGVYLLLGALTLPFNLYAQQNLEEEKKLSLSLQEATEIALEQNFSIEQAGYEVDKTKAQYRQTNAVFLPQLSFEYNAISTDDPLNVFGFKLKQEVVSQQDFNPALLNDPDLYENYSAKFEVRQPLFNPDMIMQRGAVKSKLNSANEQLDGTRNYIRYQVRQQYYNLVLHKGQLEVLETALETAGEHRRQAQNYFEQGLLSREDYLAAKVYELDMESRVLQTKNDIEKVQEELALMLGLDGAVTINPTEDLEFVSAPQIPADLSDFEVNNAQTRAFDYQVTAAQKMVKSAGFSFLPSVNLFGSYEFNDNEFANFDASSYMIGANLRWNIFTGFSKAGKVMEAKADYRKAKSMQERHLLDQENRVREAVRSLNHATKELELTEESISQSSQNVEIRTNRYEEGLEKTTDLLEAETKLAEARLKNVMALYKYNMSIAALEMLLEEDFNN